MRIEFLEIPNPATDPDEFVARLDENMSRATAAFERIAFRDLDESMVADLVFASSDLRVMNGAVTVSSDLNTPVLEAEVLAVGEGAYQIQLDWGSIDRATSYRLYRSEDEGAYSIVSDDADLSYTDTDVTPGSSYAYYVVAYNDDQTSPDSNVVIASIAVSFEVILTSRTWVRPTGLLSMTATLIAGGGGGASGGCGSSGSGTHPGGGGAGAGGGRAVRVFTVDELGTTEDLIVGAAGQGGAAVTVAGSTHALGVVGTAGGDTSFGSLLTVTGGAPGLFGISVRSVGGSGDPDTTWDGGKGGIATSGVLNPPGQSTAHGPGGGGAGGTHDTVGTTTPGAGANASTSELGTLAGGPAGVNASTIGGSGTPGEPGDSCTLPDVQAGGGGGGGGGCHRVAIGNASSFGADGGAGGDYGGGGGGGGGSWHLVGDAPTPSGAGGDSAPGAAFYSTHTKHDHKHR